MVEARRDGPARRGDRSDVQPDRGTFNPTGEGVDATVETFNPWSVRQPRLPPSRGQRGLHPVLGENRGPGGPAAELLRALGLNLPSKATARWSAACARISRRSAR